MGGDCLWRQLQRCNISVSVCMCDFQESMWGGSLETTAVMQYLCMFDLQESVSVTKVSLEMIAART